MPELPEVETVTRGLSPVLVGRTLARVEAHAPTLRLPVPADFATRLTGRQVRGLSRRSKYMLMEMDDGLVMIWHLGMSGRVQIMADAGAPPRAKHDHIIFVTDAGHRVVFNDARRFGLVAFTDVNAAAAHPLLARIGPEPLGNGFDADILSAGLKGRSGPIKTALLDQTLVAGLGNIYVCESLWRAGISPRRTASTVAGKRAERLVPHIRDVLNEAIIAGGSTLRDHAQVDGELGYFQHRFEAYGREGEACRTAGCGGTIHRITQAGRSTFFCPSCQR
ncbi:bifunctional DNA-formamidopyrimidine glycosylase/DNA-(apurinic or apyrimidinic site) lyase [Pseudokordiimonas caeni]|uniref:bifunctional DNA-formamidopyrimidine glycosylase/DNA-(apurinic or apyrimidinic site) lyase n=1 Tax=Pseudokordiimonas caeni TaxID=2997908 RepID=UPI002812109F|nr:bifunctional DNA-formamidopyrimidine glycosylase/DNA-(apurinic or apyrimidinic site) lyase [Pseudokordiimonas caeni]